MPSVWNFVGVEARTALTAFVFQVSTASGGTTTGLGVFAEATDNDAVTATARMPTSTINAFSCVVFFFISPPHPFGCCARPLLTRATPPSRRVRHGGF